MGTNKKHNSDKVAESTEEKTATKFIDVLDSEESLGGDTYIWFEKHGKSSNYVQVQMIDKDITLSFTHWAFDNFLKNLQKAQFKIEKDFELEMQERCDCDECKIKEPLK
jgi:hypothetical protein